VVGGGKVWSEEEAVFYKAMIAKEEERHKFSQKNTTKLLSIVL
jgi:hypothetical protein